MAMFLGHTSLGLSGIWWALTISSTMKGIVFFINYLLVLKKMNVPTALPDTGKCKKGVDEIDIL